MPTKVWYGLPQKAKNADQQIATYSIAGVLSVMRGNGQANNLSGVKVTLSDPTAATTTKSTLTVV